MTENPQQKGAGSPLTLF